MPRLRGFTLVELLVVIAILGILATVVVVATAASKQKARFSTAKQQERSTHNWLGEDGTTWALNEGGGTTAADWAGVAPGAISGGASYTNETPDGNGAAVSLIGGSSAVTMMPGALSGIMNSGRGFTMAVWYKSDAPQTGFHSVFARRSLSTGYMTGIFAQGNYIMGQVSTLPNGTQIVLDGLSININDGKWHYVAFSVNDITKRATLFIDGVPTGGEPFESIQYYGTLIQFNANDPFALGSVGAPYPAPAALIDNPVIIARPLK